MPEGQGRQRQPATAIAGRRTTYSAHVGGGSMSFDSAGQPLPRHRRRRRPVRRRAATGYAPLDQRYPQRYDARNTAANTNDLRGKILRIQPLRERGRRARRRHDVRRSRPATCSRPGRRRRSPRSTRWASATRSRSRRPEARPARSWSASTAPTRATNSATRGPAGHHRVEPRHQARLLRLAAVRRRQLGRQHATSATRSRAARPARASTARRRRSPTSRRTTPACRPSPARPSRADVWHKRTGDHPARFAIPTASARRSRSPARSTTTTPPTRRTTKWPAYYDGAWLDPRPLAELVARDAHQGRRRVGMLRVNGLFGTSQFGTPGHIVSDPGQVRPGRRRSTWPRGASTAAARSCPRARPAG